MIELNVPFRLFTEDQCEYLIERALQQELEWGKTYSPDVKVRTNEITWLELSEGEYDNLWNIVKDYWNEIHWYEKPIQISRYGPNQFYEWHDDAKPNRHRTSLRHLTLTCTLKSAPGAVFETELGVYDLMPGEAILFPSKLRHRALAPTIGERWSFTVWYMQRSYRNK